MTIWRMISNNTCPIIAQQSVPVLDHDTPATLHERIQEAERILYPAALAALLRGEVMVRGRRTVRRGEGETRVRDEARHVGK